MSGLIGVNNAAEKLTGILVGVNDTAAKVVRVLGGDANGIAQLLWQVGELVHIPTMTSATTPSGSTGRSTYYNDSSTYAAWHAFDKNSSTMWQSKGIADDTDKWVRYNFGYKILPISIYVKNYSNMSNFGFALEARNEEDTEWEVLVDCLSRTQQTDETFTISTTKSYALYRYHNPNRVNGRCGVYEMDVWGYKYD